jgi:hypothetical protein
MVLFGFWMELSNDCLYIRDGFYSLYTIILSRLFILPCVDALSRRR